MDLLEIIEFENESTYVDFKRGQYQKKDDFLKDIMGMANANIKGKRYIIIGVKHVPNGAKEFHPIPENEFKDDSEYQDLVRNNIEPELKFRYIPIDFKGHLLGVFEIEENDSRPYLMKKRCEKLDQGTGYIRRGSQNGLVTRADLEIMYEDRFKKKRERDIRFSYLHLLRQEFINNNRLMSRMNTYISEGPIIQELWSPSAETAEHFILEAWESLMRSGVIASLDFEEVEVYRYAVKATRDAIYDVQVAKSNWLRILTWNNPLVDSDSEPPELRQPASPRLVLQQSVHECKQSIKIAQEATMKAIELLNDKYSKNEVYNYPKLRM